MPAASPILLNSTAFTPSDIKESEEKVGVEYQAVNGRRRFAQRAIKRVWTLEWKLVPLATVNALRLVYRLTGTFTYVSESGESAMVLCASDALQTSRPFIAGDGTAYYQVTLTIKES